jgi:hypothetical protein
LRYSKSTLIDFLRKPVLIDFPAQSEQKLGRHDSHVTLLTGRDKR